MEKSSSIEDALNEIRLYQHKKMLYIAIRKTVFFLLDSRRKIMIHISLKSLQ